MLLLNFSKHFCQLFEALSLLSTRLFKKPLRPSACIVLSQTVIDFVQLQFERGTSNTLPLLVVISPQMSVVAHQCLPPTQRKISFELFKAQLTGMKNLLSYEVNPNSSKFD